MSEPIIKGETLYKAIWPRDGGNMRMLTGKVLLADRVNFYVQYGEGNGESLTQASPDGWCRTQDEALEQLLQRLSNTERYIGNDLLKVQARIQSVKNLRGQMAALEA